MSRVEGVAVADGFRPSAGASVSTLTTFPLPAHRTRRADFPHWALARDHAFAHGKLPRPHSQAFPTAAPPQSPIREAHDLPRLHPVLPAQPPARPPARPPPVPPPPAPRGRPRLPSLAHATPAGISEPLPELVGSRQSPGSLSPFRRSSRPEAPSLRRHYPASPVLRASPPPCRPKLALAGSRWTRARHRQGFPCCIRSPSRTCRRHCPGGGDRLRVVRPNLRWRLRSLANFPGMSAGRPPH